VKGIILSYLLVALGVTGSLWRPVIGLYVYIFFAVLRPRFLWGWVPGLNNLSDYVGWAMLIGWALHGFGSWRISRGKAPVVAFIFFFLWSAMSAYTAIYPSVAFPTIRELLKILLPFLVGVTMLNTPQQARLLLWVMVIAQAYVGYEMNLSYLREDYNKVAIEGYALMDNNTFGISLVSSLGPAVALALAARHWAGRAIWAVAAMLILHTILLTFSRGAFVGLLAIGATAFILMPKRPKHVVAMLIVVLLAIRLTGPELAARYSSSFAEGDDRDRSTTERLELWERMFEVALTKPVFGIGPDNWPLIAHEYGFRRGKIGHSVWIQGLAELGFLGIGSLLFFYLSTVFALWRFSRRHRKVDRDTAVIATGIILSIVGYAVSAQFVTLQHLEVPFYTVMAGVILLKAHADAPERVKEPARGEHSAATPALSLTPMPAVVRTRVNVAGLARRLTAGNANGPALPTSIASTNRSGSIE
jgi:probable O-glycosylation ligase (exosortase A-associated)